LFSVGQGYSLLVYVVYFHNFIDKTCNLKVRQMKTPALILSAAVISTVFTCCKQQGVTFSPDVFIGEWYTVKGDLDAYSFLKDSNNYIFVGTRNMHPVLFGTWKTVNDNFILSIDNGRSTSFRFTLNNDTLIFNNGEQIFTRTEPLEVRFPEVKILITLAGDFGNLKFSSPRQADLNWASYTGNTGILQNPSVIGYSISSEIESSSEDLSEIYTSLENYGFEPDTAFMKKECKVYHDDNLVIIVCTIHNSVPKSNSATIQISSGYILK
jgi:hypothetical protein